MDVQSDIQRCTAGAGVSPVLAQPIIPAGSGPLSAGTPLKGFLI